MKLEYFEEINGAQVSYKISADSSDMESPKFLEPLLFADFIPPYINDAKSYQDVYACLTKHLSEEKESFSSSVGVRRRLIWDIALNSAFYREALRNSLDLIKDNYLEDSEKRKQ